MGTPDTTTRVSVGDELELRVDSLAFGGAGVARTPGGYVVFVEGALPGDRVRARVHKRKRAY
ncbi:MAG: rRNA (uracil1939-C5)-methyltransferase, partial [Solirubrobacteraceae bacterium]|nr:rRNA (uracil1939-C5)-methyltransferase [Solirubrobacteraceae bacterium]